MIQFEQTFMNFLFHHQEKFNRTYHFLILMDAVISAAKHIQHYYLTGALKGNLGLAGEVNIQGEEVMRMDQIAHEIVIHYLKTSERVIHAVSEEEELIIPLEEKRDAISSILIHLTVPRMYPMVSRWDFSSALPRKTSKGLKMDICAPAMITLPQECLLFQQEHLPSHCVTREPGDFTLTKP